jgi:GWxTD domain-containing protein
MKRLLFTLLFTLVAASTIPSIAAAQKAASTPRPDEKPRKVRNETPDAHKRWLTEDVPYIITDAEKKALLALKTDEEREAFIQTFWDRRDPDPNTETNEFREQYYERIAYANEHFSTGIPGWRTDRGRIYIRWGAPDSTESHPSGGGYNRPGTEGGGTITAYPFETWFYRHLDDVGDGVEIEFVDRTGTGEYKIATDIDEKNALRSTYGARTTSENSRGFMRERDSELSKILKVSALETPPKVRFSDLDRIASGDSGIQDNNPLDLDVRIDFFRQSDDRVITLFTAETSNRGLQFADVGGVPTATLNVFGRVTAVAGKLSGIFEDSLTTSSTAGDLSASRESRSIYQKAIALAPGVYKVAVVMRDVNTGNRGLINLGFTVPKYEGKKLSTSSIILASTIRSATDRDLGAMFVIGGAKVVPSLSGVFRLGQQVGVYMQIYNAATDQTTLRPAADVEYVVTDKTGKEMLRQKEDWKELSDSGQRLVLARLLPTDRLAAGDYEIKVEIKDRVSGQTIENKGKFSIAK